MPHRDPVVARRVAKATSGKSDAFQIGRRRSQVSQVKKNFKRPENPPTPGTTAEDRSFSGNNAPLRKMVAQISRPDLELYEAVSSPAGRQQIRGVRAALAARTRREADDDIFLMQIGHRLLGPDVRGRPRPTLAAAVREVVDRLVVAGLTRSGDRRVKLGTRVVSEVSALKHLEQKFRRHRREIARRVLSPVRGQRLALRYVAPAIDAQGGEVTIRIPINQVSMASVSPAVLKRGAQLVDKLSLSDAADGFHREALRLIRRARRS